MNLQELMDAYHEEGLTRELAAARVCQDIVLKAIAEGPLSRNVTIKGGVVMRSLTKNNRRATRDIDLDFIHYSLDDFSIREFVKRLNCIDGIQIYMDDEITELKHQDYHGKSIEVKIVDEYGNSVKSKIDIGVHNDGLAHISKLSKNYIKHPSDVVSVGDIVDCYVISIDKEKEKVGLSLLKEDGV